MKLTYLGTAAAEGLPAVWCNCSVCRAAKAAGGKNVRTRSQILIDDRVLLDFPMDTYLHVLQNKLDLSKVDTVLITHAHMDHCYPQEFNLHGEPFAHGMSRPTVTVYGNKTVKKTFKQATRAEMKAHVAASVPFVSVRPYERFTAVGGYTITALPAVHTKGEHCFIYAIEKEGKTALLCNDSGILPDEQYARMAAMGLRFDLVSFDATYGYARHGKGRHMGAQDAADEREKMKAHRLVHDNTRYVLTHFSHNCDLNHAQLCEKVQNENFTVAYDGMQTEI
ncbi:MAG: hypothetical protein HFE46_04505 [Clostridia bacterium]|jgi:phosphoribosyl 1,2-cyclic phosphate phosphodiesterase|nr:hypothetical protein [Clostridia bacterium]